MALVIGLTGGIGSGKSTVAHYFFRLGVPVIDADEIARELCCAGHDAFKKIVERFGENILDLKGEIDRKKLRKVIFKNPVERTWLEGVLHPLIIEAILSWVDTLDVSYCVVVVPLLLETSMKDYVDRILVVDALEKEQIERAVERDESDNDVIRTILNRQLSRRERVELADDVILNDAGFEELEEKVVKLNVFYMELANRL